MKEYWINFRLKNGHESIVVMPSKLKVFLWLLRYGWNCTRISISVMLDL